MDSYEVFCKARNEMDGWVDGIYVGNVKPIENQDRPKRIVEAEKTKSLSLGWFLISFLMRI